ncbi:MAG: AraC family transcriptional regulator [Marinobacter sp.]|nr:AraC family transcriptional regulator [Marinobacter sp.]
MERFTTAGHATFSTLIVRHCLECYGAQGYPLPPLLREVGLSMEELADNSLRVPLVLVETLIRKAVEFSDEPELGLRLSMGAFPSKHPMLGLVLQICPDLHALLRTIDHFEHLVCDAISSPLLPEPGGGCWSFEYFGICPVVQQQVIDFCLGFRLEFLQALAQDMAIQPRMIFLRRPEPASPAALALYKERFGCPITFSALHNGFSLSKETLGLKAGFSSLPMEFASLSGTLGRDLQAGASNLVRSARLSLRGLLLEGRPSRELLADRLGVGGGRQLHRELARVGTSYQEMLDELRLDMAMDFLQNTQLTLDVIADRLAFQEGTSFSRWFRRKAAMSPSRFRERGAAGLPGIKKGAL